MLLLLLTRGKAYDTDLLPSLVQHLWGLRFKSINRYFGFQVFPAISYKIIINLSQWNIFKYNSSPLTNTAMGRWKAAIYGIVYPDVVVAMRTTLSYKVKAISCSDFEFVIWHVRYLNRLGDEINWAVPNKTVVHVVRLLRGMGFQNMVLWINLKFIQTLMLYETLVTYDTSWSNTSGPICTR